MPKKKRLLCSCNYVGVDPGKEGGLVFLSRLGEIYLDRMPQTERDVWDWFNNVRPDITKATIEWIHPAIQGAGKSSMSKLYGNYMALRMALTAAEIPFEIVKPLEWQRGMGIAGKKKTENRTQWKDRLRARAQQIFPKLPVWNSTLREQRAVCDALLIAEYCRRKDQGKL